MQKLVPNSAILVPDRAMRVFAGKIFDVYQWQQAMYDGQQSTFEMLKRPDTVETICVVDGKIIVLVDEQPHRGARLSFPGGRVDATDETAEAAARREVAEETGYAFKNWRLVLVAQPQRKIEWFVHTFVAWEPLSRSAIQLDGGEKIEEKMVDVGGLRELLDTEELVFPEGRALIKQTRTAADLCNLPAFTGKQVDR